MKSSKAAWICSFLSLSCFAHIASAEPHTELFNQKRYPSAKDCQSCHPKHFAEWSVSPHAYASISPVFNSLHGEIVRKTSGTSGDFCIRCHTPAGMNLEEKIFIPAEQRSEIAREGVTCITCHRRAEPYGKVNGRIGLEEGELFSPVYGPTGNHGLNKVLEGDRYSVNTDPEKEGLLNIHTNAIEMPQITTSGFCGSCHDVNNVAGFRLEEAFSEYKASPAAKEGTSCQDCHMGKTPGVADGYDFEPVAVVGGITTPPRKRTSHLFAGPDYSIVHPGIFPHNPEAQRLAEIKDWLSFQVEAGWGTDDFEDTVESNEEFPERWQDAGDRYEAREVLEYSQELLAKASDARLILLRNGYKLGEFKINQANTDGLDFSVEFQNGTTGHNVPTGFDADRLVFLQVTVKDQSGRIILQSGDLDPNGDVRDSHSLYVQHGILPLDEQLFTLQSRFLIRMMRGGEREQVIPVNASVDPLPFVRPPTSSTLLMGRPAGARKHRMTIPAGQSVWANYQVSSRDLKGNKGPYEVNVKLIAAMIPVNLVHAIEGVGFDFNLSTRSIADAVVAGHQILWERTDTLSTYENKPIYVPRSSN